MAKGSDRITRKDAIEAATQAACDWVNGDVKNPDKGISYHVALALKRVKAIESDRPVASHKYKD